MGEKEKQVLENFERLTILYTGREISLEEYVESIKSLLEYSFK